MKSDFHCTFKCLGWASLSLLQLKCLDKQLFQAQICKKQILFYPTSLFLIPPAFEDSKNRMLQSGQIKNFMFLFPFDINFLYSNVITLFTDLIIFSSVARFFSNHLKYPKYTS